MRLFINSYFHYRYTAHCHYHTHYSQHYTWSIHIIITDTLAIDITTTHITIIVINTHIDITHTYIPDIYYFLFTVLHGYWLLTQILTTNNSHFITIGQAQSLHNRQPMNSHITPHHLMKLPGTNNKYNTNNE